MKRLVMLCAVGLLAGSCFVGSPDARVLFVGNSYTSTNDLPGMVRDLAAATDIRLEVTSVAPGGWRLRDHVEDPDLVSMIESGDYDYLIVQEQSAIPSAPGIAEADMYPPARQLSVLATSAGTDMILFQTWGYRDGLGDIGHSSYSSMQVAIIDTYADLGARLGRIVAPVGQAFWMFLGSNPAIPLHQPDGSHPTREGTYLAAAVIASLLTGLSPVEMQDDLGLEAETAAQLRVTAATVTK